MTQERSRTYMGNVPPQATDVEEAVLGAMMVSSDNVDQVIDLLKPEAFYDPKNKVLFEAMLELFNERSPIDMLTVIERLRQNLVCLWTILSRVPRTVCIMPSPAI